MNVQFSMTLSPRVPLKSICIGIPSISRAISGAGTSYFFSRTSRQQIPSKNGCLLISSASSLAPSRCVWSLCSSCLIRSLASCDNDLGIFKAPFLMFSKSRSLLLLQQGGMPISSSQRSSPRRYQSTALEWPVLLRIQGARQASEPQKEQLSSLFGISLLSPKSVSFMCPFSSITTFSGFRSLNRISLWCSSQNARISSATYTLATASLTFFFRESSCPRSPPGQYSRAMNSLSSFWKAWLISTMNGCFMIVNTFFQVLAQRTRFLPKILSFSSIFIASSFLLGSAFKVARQTSPNEPLPSILQQSNELGLTFQLSMVIRSIAINLLSRWLSFTPVPTSTCRVFAFLRSFMRNLLTWSILPLLSTTPSYLVLEYSSESSSGSRFSSQKRARSQALQRSQGVRLYRFLVIFFGMCCSSSLVSSEFEDSQARCKGVFWSLSQPRNIYLCGISTRIISV